MEFILLLYISAIEAKTQELQFQLMQHRTISHMSSSFELRT